MYSFLIASINEITLSFAYKAILVADRLIAPYFLGVLTRNQKNLFIDIITDPTAYCFAASAGIKAQLHPHLRLHFKI